ncbi:MAG: hypothetical protein KGY61_11125 [Desulfobacterales bacterium]|nr:hypothetical protein [Desulfobacterales bacterium]
MKNEIQSERMAGGHRKSLLATLRVLITLHSQVCDMMIPYLEPVEFISEEQRKLWRRRLPVICRSRCGLARTAVKDSSELTEAYFRFDGDNL